MHSLRCKVSCGDGQATESDGRVLSEDVRVVFRLCFEESLLCNGHACKVSVCMYVKSVIEYALLIGLKHAETLVCVCI